MSFSWYQLITLAFLAGWASSLFLWIQRFGEQPQVLLALVGLWFIAFASILTALPAAEYLLSHNIVRILQAIGKPVLVGLAVSMPVGIWARKRVYVQVIRWTILGLIGVYVVLEVIKNDLLQRGLVVTYVGALLGYAFTGVATWQLTRKALSNLPADSSGNRS